MTTTTEATATDTTPSAPPAAAEPASKNARTYIVLRFVGDGNFKRVDDVVATSDEQAVRKTVEKSKPDGALIEGGSLGEYVAIPVRGWHVHKPRVEQTERLRF